MNYPPDISKVTNPTLRNLAEEYAESGIPTYVDDILQTVPSGLRGPLEYTFAEQLSKEKPLLITHTAAELGASPERALGVAACTDVLWSSSIMIDDIYDRDETRAGQQPSAWAKFGKTRTMAASLVAITATVAYVTRKYGPRQADIMTRDLRRGVTSISQAKHLSLDAPVEAYNDNYDMRAGFYSIFPIGALRKHSQANPQQISGAQRSLLHIHRSGQIINDLRDFDQSGDRLRTAPFSDIRAGVSTIPIRHMWQSMGLSDKQRYEQIHGKRELTSDDLVFIGNLVIDTDLGQAMSSRIESLHNDARGEYIEAVNPSDETIQWLDALLGYMRETAQIVSTTLGNIVLTD